MKNTRIDSFNEDGKWKPIYIENQKEGRKKIEEFIEIYNTVKNSKFLYEINNAINSLENMYENFDITYKQYTLIKEMYEERIDNNDFVDMVEKQKEETEIELKN